MRSSHCVMLFVDAAVRREGRSLHLYEVVFSFGLDRIGRGEATLRKRGSSLARIRFRRAGRLSSTDDRSRTADERTAGYVLSWHIHMHVWVPCIRCGRERVWLERQTMHPRRRTMAHGRYSTAMSIDRYAIHHVAVGRDAMKPDRVERSVNYPWSGWPILRRRASICRSPYPYSGCSCRNRTMMSYDDVMPWSI